MLELGDSFGVCGLDIILYRLLQNKEHFVFKKSVYS